MGIFNILDPALNLLFGWTKLLPSSLGILILALIITLITTLIYKYTTDQKLLKSVKEKQKKLQEEMKKSRDNPKKMMKINKEMMELSMSMMKESFKSMLYTILPILILFGWIASNYSFQPATANQPLQITVYGQNMNGNLTLMPLETAGINEQTTSIINNQANFTIIPTQKGVHDLTFNYNTRTETKKINIQEPTISFRDVKLKKTFADYIYSSPEGGISTDSEFTSIKVDYKPIKPFGTISIFGWKPGWFGTYIIFSLILTMLLRKLLKVY